MPSFTCSTCNTSFDVPDATLAKYPGWTPRFCAAHRQQRSGGASGSRFAKAAPAPKPPRDPNVAPTVTRLPPAAAYGSKTFRGSAVGSPSELRLSPEEVLERYNAGPQDGIFTDGGCDPNPGAGGWAFVHVEGGEIVAQGSDCERLTTNNRMEMTAIIEALKSLPKTAQVTIHSDSDLCVKTLTIWAKSWKANGWKKKTGEVKNLDLVMEAYDLLHAHPHVKMQWVRAHDGTRWNEYVDALAGAALRRVARR